MIVPEIQTFGREHRPTPNLLPAMNRANLLGFYIPEKYGGLGMDYISLGLARDELEYGDTSARAGFAAGEPIARHAIRL